MFILGLILLAIGYFAAISILVTIGWVVLIIGVILLVLSATGHGGGRYYY